MRTTRGQWLGGFGWALLSVLAANRAAAQEPAAVTARATYDAALTLAREAQSPEQIQSAARLLASMLRDYPQDFELPLELAWLLFRAGRYSEALPAYQVAESRSPSAMTAQLGIGWTLLRLGRREAAREKFQAILAHDPANANASDGLRACSLTATPAFGSTTKRLWMQPLVAQSVYLYENQPYLKYTLATVARLDALIREHWYAAALYRYSHFFPSSTTISAWDQHDLFLYAGYTAPRFGLTLQYALLADQSGYLGTSHHVGLSARYSFGWDAILNLSASVFQDAPVLRGELSARVPVFGGLSFRPGFALQWTSAEVYKTAMLSASYDHRRFSVWGGGKVGDEQRPAYLGLGYVYNVTSRIPYGAYAGAAIRPGAGFTLSFSYTYDRLLRTDVTPSQDSLAHSITLGLSREF